MQAQLTGLITSVCFKQSRVKMSSPHPQLLSPCPVFMGFPAALGAAGSQGAPPAQQGCHLSLCQALPGHQALL